MLALLIFVDRIGKVAGFLDEDMAEAERRRPRRGAEPGWSRADDGNAQPLPHVSLPRAA